jgi:Formin Homology 2 Domain
LKKALAEVKGSPSLKIILSIVLALDNYLNGGSPRGGSYGFKLEGLMKLAAVKSIDNKTSLMPFLALHCEKYNISLLDISKELSSVGEASRISIESCRGVITNLRKNIDIIEQQLLLPEADAEKDSDDRFEDSLSPFKVAATAEINQIEGQFQNMVKWISLVRIAVKCRLKSSLGCYETS